MCRCRRIWQRFCPEHTGTLDGYPLTQRGRGLEALGLAMLSSCLGGFISSLALLFISPLLAQVALKFGSA